MNIDLSELDFSNPVQDALDEALDTFCDRVIPDDALVKIASMMSDQIRSCVTPTPSLNDIEEFVDEHISLIMNVGGNSHDVCAVEAYMVASFGFVGNELDALQDDSDDDEDWF